MQFTHVMLIALLCSCIVVLLWLLSNAATIAQENILAKLFAQYVECLVDAEFSVKGKARRVRMHGSEKRREENPRSAGVRKM